LAHPTKKQPSGFLKGSLPRGTLTLSLEDTSLEAVGNEGGRKEEEEEEEQDVEDVVAQSRARDEGTPLKM
jgi:hypothetical protein